MASALPATQPPSEAKVFEKALDDIANGADPNSVIEIRDPIHGDDPLLLHQPRAIDKTNDVPLLIVLADRFTDEPALLGFDRLFQQQETFTGNVLPNLLHHRFKSALGRTS